MVSVRQTFVQRRHVALLWHAVAMWAAGLLLWIPEARPDWCRGDYDCTSTTLPHAGADNTTVKKVTVNGHNTDYTTSACAGEWQEFIAGGGGDCDVAGGSGCGGCIHYCGVSWDNSNNPYSWPTLPVGAHVELYGDVNQYAFIRFPHTGYPQTLTLKADRAECGVKTDQVGIQPRTVTINVTAPPYATYFGRYHNLLTGETLTKWSDVWKAATQEFLRDEFENDLVQLDPAPGVHCCSGVQVGDVLTSFTDWGGYDLYDVDSLTELDMVFGLSGNFKVVHLLEYCDGYYPPPGCAGCTDENTDNIVFPTDSGGPVAAHEHGHTAVLEHSEDTTTTDDDNYGNIMQSPPGLGVVAPFQRDAIISHR